MFGVYLHIPFCRRRCKYCDFITYANRENIIPRYARALCDEITWAGTHKMEFPSAAISVYFGGGTPSLFEAENLDQILQTLRAEVDIVENAEITIEANPGTLSSQYLRDLLSVGFNRISLGIQSFFDLDLKILGRIHSASESIQAIDETQRAGFSNISLDLMFALPGQSFSDWQKNVEKALSFEPEHLSLYSLIVEPGTVIERQVMDGTLQLPSADLEADMFEWAMEYLSLCGYEQYEISSWAKDTALESAHNKIYWRNQSYLGLGTAAHSSLWGKRFYNIDDIDEYIRRFDNRASTYNQDCSPATAGNLFVDLSTSMKETMMLGLRLTREGVSTSGFFNRYHQKMENTFEEEIKKIRQAGLAEWKNFSDGPHLVLTKRGVMVGNQVFKEFV